MEVPRAPQERREVQGEKMGDCVESGRVAGGGKEVGDG